MTTRAGSHLANFEASGAWRLAGGRLRLDYDDGGARDDEVALHDDAMQLGDQRWDRLDE